MKRETVSEKRNRKMRKLKVSKKRQSALLNLVKGKHRMLIACGRVTK